MAEDGKREGKWEGKVSAQLRGPITAEQVWPLIEDFCGIHKWHPHVDTCHASDGSPTTTTPTPAAQPGLIRYCASTVASEDSAGEKTMKWAKERLVEVDPVGRRLSYEVQDNNVGFRHWIAAMRVLAVDGGGCEIEWSFVGEPPEGWNYGDIVSYYEFCLKSIAKKMEHALLSPHQ